MNEDKAIKLFIDYIHKEYADIVILSKDEKKKRFLFEFCEKGDLTPIDYPIISVNKSNGKIEKLFFINPKDRDIIYGE